MNKESETRGISRRKFISGLGAGVVGGAVLPGALQAKQKGGSEKSASPGIEKVKVSLKVNGKPHQFLLEPNTTLAQVLREHLNLTGAKIMCNHGECGACTVVMNGEAVYSCHILALDAEGAEVITVEGLMDGEKLHPLQEAFTREDGMQCGFCTPGQVMAAYALLLKNKKPSLEEVKKRMSGNLCRCGAYPNIQKSVLAAAEKGGIS